MPTPLDGLLATPHVPADAVAATLAHRERSWRVLSALRAEDEARFFEAVPRFLEAELAKEGLIGGRWSALAHRQLEGAVGGLEERSCDYLAAADLAALARALPACTAADLADIFRVAELGDAESTARLGERLAAAERRSLPDELYSDVLGAKRLYAAIRARFSTVDEEVEYLQSLGGMRQLAAGASTLAEAHGRAWEEVIPSHARGATNASRALTFALAAAGDATLAKWLAPVLSHARAKARVECAGLAWDERFDGVGGGQAASVRRHRAAVIAEVGKAHPEVPALPNRPRRTVKVHATIAKAEADFRKTVEKLTAKHGLGPIAVADLEGALQRTVSALPSDYGVALLELGVPQPDLFWFRGDPELTRRAIALGADASRAVGPDGRDLLAHLGPTYQDLQRAEVLVAAGARSRSPERLLEAAKRGELRLAKLLLQAGAPVDPKAVEAAQAWPRLGRLLGQLLGQLLGDA